MKKMFKNVLGISLLIIMSVVFIGCGKYPESELSKSQTLIQEITTIDGDCYLPDEYAILNDSLNIALNMIEEQKSKVSIFRNYKSATEVLNSIILSSEKLKIHTIEKAKSMLSEIQTIQIENNTLVEKLPIGKGEGEAIKLIKEELGLIDGILIEISTMFENNQFDGSFDKLTAVREQILAKNMEIKSVLDKANISY
jgi:hypothetical protein